MTKDEFRELYLQALNVAADSAEEALAQPIPRSFLIELHGIGGSGSERLLTVEEALDALYLGNDRFYRIIDVAVKKLLPNNSVIFVRPSGHPPDKFEKTWYPGGKGPFKQIYSTRIEDDRHSVSR
jgi:hypothetical protein